MRDFTIFYYLYEVCFREGGEGNGALLRYQFQDGKVGFASLPAWPHLGDQTIEDKLAGLRSNPCLEPQWSWACLDARLRQENQPALPGDVRLPASHWHLRTSELNNEARWAELIAEGYPVWKIKVSPTLSKEVCFSHLTDFARQHSVKLRLDGNGTFDSLDQLAALFETVADLSAIEFLEDPSRDLNLWAETKRRWRVRLAADWIRPDGNSCDLFVHKPTRDAKVDDGKDFVVTTAFDHPLGVNYTAYQSLALLDHPRLIQPFGIAHPGLYTCDGLESSVTVNELGFGWAQLLESLAWIEL